MNPVLYSRVIKKIQHYIKYPYSAICASIFVARHRENKNVYTIVLDHGIGDTVFVMKLLEQFADIYPERRIKVVACNSNEKLISAFKRVQYYEYYERGNILVNEFIHNGLVAKIAKKWNIINTNPYLYYRRGNLDNSELSLICRKALEIRYDSDSRTTVALNNRGNRCKLRQKIIIINPYSLSIKHTNIDFYVEIAKKALDKGYIVYTNCVGVQSVIPGTKKLDCDIWELFDFASRSAGIISLRSGILDFLECTGISMAVLYQNCNEKFKEIYTMKQWRNDNSIIEIDLDSEKWIDVLNRLEIWLNEVARHINEKESEEQH